MFLNYNSDLRYPPFLLAGFLGIDFPAFNRYYGDTKTAFALLLPFSFLRYRYLAAMPLLNVLSTGIAYLTDLDGYCVVNPYTNCSLGGGRLSHVPCNPYLPLTRSQTTTRL